MKRHDVKVLREAGMSGSEVARQAEVSLRTVRRIDREEPVSASTEDLAKARGVARMAAERARLRPLAIDAAQYALRFP